MKISICYEDEYIIAVNKPNNVLVHHSHMARNQSDEHSLLELLFEQTAKHYYPIHRLDRKTSGIILCAKDKLYVSKFQQLFIANQIHKTYVGLVRGFCPESGEINTPVKGRDANTHKDALTHFKRLKTVESSIAVHPYNSSRYSWVELYPKTGRLHQLRIHMNKISHPLIGDPKYGDRHHNRMFANEFDCSHLFLHAKQLEFIHPYTHKPMVILAELPPHWQKVQHHLNFI
ncbi:MAG: pseudouridine synthase [Flavobacteriaceae bacterium]